MAKSKAGSTYIGVGGWNFAPWRGTFYPKGLTQSQELHFAGRQLTSTEINSTFYGLQKPAVLKRWRDHARTLARHGDVYFYFISGAKVRNPLAARALIAAL